MKTLSHLLLSSACLLPLFSTVACSQSTEIASESESIGTLDLALLGVSPSGTTYQLTAATFEVVGPENQVVDGAPPVVSVDVPVGSYSVELQAGWQLQRLDGSTWVPVDATLLSPNPETATITEGNTSDVVFRFQAGDEIVVLGEGTLNIRIEVEDPVTTSPENTDAACENGLDDDGDGSVDCDDSGCAALPVCAVGPTLPLLIDDFNDGDLNAGTTGLVWAPLGATPPVLRPNSTPTGLGLQAIVNGTPFAGPVIGGGANYDMSTNTGIQIDVRRDAGSVPLILVVGDGVNSAFVPLPVTTSMQTFTFTLDQFAGVDMSKFSALGVLTFAPAAGSQVFTIDNVRFF